MESHEPSKIEHQSKPPLNPVVLLIAGALIFGAGFASSQLLSGPSQPTSNDEILALQAQIEGIATQVDNLQNDMVVVRNSALGIEDVSEDDDPALGSADAPVVIIEFSDFQCPYCRRFHVETFDQLKEEFVDTGLVRFVYRDFPLVELHPNAAQAALAAECADDQGQFWTMHNVLFDKQPEWQESEQLINQFQVYAVQSGLNLDQFNACLTEQRHYQEIGADLQSGIEHGVQGTPHFFINGRRMNGALPISSFRAAIEEELAKLN